MNTTPQAAGDVAVPVTTETQSAMDWGAVLAGAVVAAGVASVFATFGVGVGLASISPYEGDGSALAELLALALWAVWTAVSSVMAGAYIAGRMRRRIGGVTADEVSVRDGVHGLAVWGAAILLGAWLAGSAVETATTTAAEMTGAVATAVTGEGDTAAGAETSASAVAEPSPEAVAMAQRYSVLAAFVAAASMLIAAAGGYWAAGVGGQHRDENRVFKRFGRWT